MTAPDVKTFPTRPAAQRYVDRQHVAQARPELADSGDAARGQRSTSKGRWVIRVGDSAFVRSGGSVR